MWLDIILGLILAICILWGLVKGGIRSVFGVLGIILGIIIGSRLSSKFASVVPIGNHTISLAISFIIIFVIIVTAAHLAGFLVYKATHFLRVGILDKLVGLIFGIVKGSLLAGILCLFISLFPRGHHVVQRSRIAPIVFHELYLLKSLFPKEFRDRLKWRTRRKPLHIPSHDAFV